MHAFLLAGNAVKVFQRCTKIPYVSHHEARRALNAHRRPSGLVDTGYGSLRPYRCKICGAFHTGHR